MRALVVGMGVSGRSAKAFLEARGYDVWGYDDEMAPQPPAGPFDLVVASPGVPATHPVLLGRPFIGEAELAARHMRCRAVGITGTNGKTTTTLMVAHALGGRAVGNVGTPLTSVDLAPEDIAVVELSSYQLETLQTPFLEAAVILNIAPDHLDRYASFEAYAAAKYRMARCVKPGGCLFLGAALKVLPIKSDIVVETLPSMSYREDVSPDVENGLAAFALCHALGMERETFDRAMATFVKPPHRCEPVAVVRGVAYVNDSKGTNVDATRRAVEGLAGPVVLIAGGRDKGTPYTPWQGAFAGKVAHVCLIGEAAGRIATELAGTCSTSHHPSLEAAVQAAARMAPKGSTVLLSPGCASFDMFESFEARGDRFKQLVKELAL